MSDFPSYLLMSKQVYVTLGDDVTATCRATVEVGPSSTTESFLQQCRTKLGIDATIRLRIFRFCFQVYYRVRLPNDYDSDWLVSGSLKHA
jgi:hypothetical protein